MEEKRTRQFSNLFIAAFFLIITFYFAYGFFVARKPSDNNVLQQVQSLAQPTIALVDYVSYQGRAGKNALFLLQEKATIEQATSGLVTAINSRKADASAHEYWAFYVNGKLGQVGPADYQTKEGDKIEWKIEKY